MKSTSDQEIEVKFYLPELSAFEKRLQAQGARLIQPRTHEHNLRLDTPDGQLSRTHQVLRLRRDEIDHLTYKGPSQLEGGVSKRQEIEFTISDLDTARQFFQALGYQISVVYEKYRTRYSLDEVIIALDEMPFGHFVELEGPDARSLRTAANRLGLNWETRLTESYLALFAKVKHSIGLNFRDLTFENFEGIEISPGALGVRPADEDR